MGGNVVKPTYRQVCNGDTGHVEVVQLEYDATKTTYEDLVKFFFCMHDPTTLNRQAGDHGTQYASVIFVHNDEQRKIAEKVKASLQAALNSKKVTFARNFENTDLATDIRAAGPFYEAHEEHQDYLFKNEGGYCSHRYYIKFDQFPSDSKL